MLKRGEFTWEKDRFCLLLEEPVSYTHLHVLPASYQVEEGLKLPGVKVLMKAGKKLPQIKELLQKENFSACGVQRCGMEGQALYRSTEEIDPEAGYYSLFIVDEK